MKPLHVTGVLSVVLFGAACAGAPKPTGQLVQAESAIRAADEVGVDNVPQAQLHQKLANEQVERARKLMEEDEHRLARSTLERAKADAELALALARESEAKSAAEKAEAALNSAPKSSSGSGNGPSASAN